MRIFLGCTNILFFFILSACSKESSTIEEVQNNPKTLDQAAAIYSSPTVTVEQLDPEEALKILESFSEADKEAKIYSAIRSLGIPGNTSAIETLLKAFKVDNPIIKELVVISLGQIGDEHAVPVLLEGAKSSSLGLRYHSVQSLGQIGDPQANSLLEKIANNDPIPRVRQMAQVSLRAIRERELLKK
jgi:HEAT repeat protein